MKCNIREMLTTWNQLDFYLANLETLMQIWDDFLHEFENHPKDPEERHRYLETLHIATSCVLNKAVQLRVEEVTASLEEHKRHGLGVVGNTD